MFGSHVPILVIIVGPTYLLKNFNDKNLKSVLKEKPGVGILD